MNQALPLEKRIQAFVKLGTLMSLAAGSFETEENDFQTQYPGLYDSLHQATYHNPWFTPLSIAYALHTWGKILTEESITLWIKNYKAGIETQDPMRIAVIMAGNIPLVGFHDFICTLISGHSIIGKLSSNDKILLPAMAEALCMIEPSFKSRIEFTESTIKDFEAIIATGSNNTARYFEYYFLKYPHIIRKNRNGIAVLRGDESLDEMERLGNDICTYFGLGCRNVSKVFIPFGYDPTKLFLAIEPFVRILSDHYKYMNNYSYHRSIYLLNNTPHFDNGVFILTESEQYASPIPVLYYQFYDNRESLLEKVALDDELIQCIANDDFTDIKAVPLGGTQSPGLSDYADGIDTMKFLLNL